MTDRPLLVVLGLSPTGLYVVREAAACGVAVMGCSDGRECGATSRFLDNCGVATVCDAESLVGRLRELADRHGQLAAIPTTDRHVEFLVRHAGSLPSELKFANAYRSSAGKVGLDKSAISNAARQAGLLVPEEHDLANGQFEPSGDDFPFILKPKSIHHQRHWLKGRKLFLVEGVADWMRILELKEFVPSEWTVQVLVHGPESNIKVAAVHRVKDGKATCFTASKLRQYPINFGSASLLVSEQDDEVQALSLRLLSTMEFEGIAGVEFKRDRRDGQLYLIEMNPRPSLWFSAATAHGDFLVHEQLREWFGDVVHPPILRTSNNVTWRYGLKDRLAARAHRRSRSIDAIPPPDVRSAESGQVTWAVYQRDDPRPALSELSVYARKGLSRLLS